MNFNMKQQTYNCEITGKGGSYYQRLARYAGTIDTYAFSLA